MNKNVWKLILKKIKGIDKRKNELFLKWEIIIFAQKVNVKEEKIIEDLGKIIANGQKKILNEQKMI